MVLEFVERNTRRYSGVTGAEFWFTIKEVKKFDGPEKPNFVSKTLKGRSADLNDHNQLQIVIEDIRGRADDAVDAFDESIKGKTKFIIATSADACCFTGTQVDKFWGSMRHESVYIVPFSKRNLAKIDELYMERK